MNDHKNMVDNPDGEIMYEYAMMAGGVDGDCDGNCGSGGSACDGDCAG